MGYLFQKPGESFISIYCESFEMALMSHLAMQTSHTLSKHWGLKEVHLRQMFRKFAKGMATTAEQTSCVKTIWVQPCLGPWSRYCMDITRLFYQTGVLQSCDTPVQCKDDCYKIKKCTASCLIFWQRYFVNARLKKS